MEAFNPKLLPLSKGEINRNYYFNELVDACSSLESYKSSLKYSKLDSTLFLPTLQKKEAYSSMAIEGTQATLDEVLTSRTLSNEKNKEIQEVFNFYKASSFGFKMLEKTSINNDFIKITHKIIMKDNVRGMEYTAGEYRQKQNYILKSDIKTTIKTYVPPVPEKVGSLMENLVHYINNYHDEFLPLERIAIIHAQFETIHPFMDGNGRVGRILIPLYLCQSKQIESPCFFISDALERDKFKYFRLLNETRYQNNWNDWIKFFLEVVKLQCKKYINAIDKINALYEKDLNKIKSILQTPRAVDIINLLFKSPIVSCKDVSEDLKLPTSSVMRYLNILEKNRILYPGDSVRNKNFYYYDLLNIIRD